MVLSKAMDLRLRPLSTVIRPAEVFGKANVPVSPLELPVVAPGTAVQLAASDHVPLLSNPPQVPLAAFAWLAPMTPTIAAAESIIPAFTTAIRRFDNKAALSFRPFMKTLRKTQHETRFPGHFQHSLLDSTSHVLNRF